MIDVSKLDIRAANNQTNYEVGQEVALTLRKNDWEQCPIVDFGHKYLVLNHRAPIPGLNKMTVIDITKFNRFDDFKIAEINGYGFVHYEDEGFSVLTVINGKEFWESTNPWTAVLPFKVAPVTADEMNEIKDELDAQLDMNGPRRM